MQLLLLREQHVITIALIAIVHIVAIIASHWIMRYLARYTHASRPIQWHNILSIAELGQDCNIRQIGATDVTAIIVLL